VVSAFALFRKVKLALPSIKMWLRKFLCLQRSKSRAARIYSGVLTCATRDTVAELLRRLNVDDINASNYLRNHKAAASLYRISAGKDIQRDRADGSLISLRFINDSGSHVIIEKTEDSLQYTRLRRAN